MASLHTDTDSDPYWRTVGILSLHHLLFDRVTKQFAHAQAMQFCCNFFEICRTACVSSDAYDFVFRALKINKKR